MHTPVHRKADGVDVTISATSRQDKSAVVVDDHRPLAMVQRQLIDMANNSPRVVSQRLLSDQINNSPRVIAQRQHAASLASAESVKSYPPRPNNTGLPDQLKAGVESLSGMNLDHVKVHFNSAQPAQLNALAYTRGSDIYVGPGQEHHLPHEAWHVVQQARGRVRATRQMVGVRVNDDARLEKEANVMGGRALQMRQFVPASSQAHVADGIVQCAWVKGDDVGEKWDQLIDGVQWHKDKENRMWFDDVSSNRQHFWAGRIHSYTYEQWDAIEKDVRTPELDHAEAIARIKNFQPSSKPINIGSSRPKFVYFFNGNGDNVQKREEASFMIDTGMLKDEISNYEEVRARGVKVPKIYGFWSNYPIVEFLPAQTTVSAQLSGGIASAVETTIRKLKILKQWQPQAWKSALVDLNVLIKTGYHSPDLQFMVDNKGGRIYVMDMESIKPPYFDGKPDEGLLRAKDVIETETGSENPKTA